MEHAMSWLLSIRFFKLIYFLFTSLFVSVPCGSVQKISLDNNVSLLSTQDKKISQAQISITEKKN